MDDLEMEEQNPHTVWVNTTQDTFRFGIFQGPGLRPYRVHVKPGEEVSLPSEWDDAIAHKAKGSNTVTGGLCPRLRKKSELGKPENISPALLGVERAATPAELEKRAADRAAALAAAQNVGAGPLTVGKPAKQQPQKPTEA